MGALIPALMALLQAVAPATAGSSVIGTVITVLVQLVPVLVQEYQDVLPMVQNIIGALRSNTVITPDQLAQLDALDAQVDAAFEAAAAAAEAQDQ